MSGEKKEISCGHLSFFISSSYDSSKSGSVSNLGLICRWPWKLWGLNRLRWRRTWRKRSALWWRREEIESTTSRPSTACCSATRILSTWERARTHARIYTSVNSWFHGFTLYLLFQDLRVALGEKEQKLKEAAKEVELWRQKERALTTVLQEKEAQISFLQTALQEVRKHVTTSLEFLFWLRFYRRWRGRTAGLFQSEEICVSRASTHGVFPLIPLLPQSALTVVDVCINDTNVNYSRAETPAVICVFFLFVFFPSNNFTWSLSLSGLWLVRIHLRWLIYLSWGRKVAPACARRSLISPVPCRTTSSWCRWDDRGLLGLRFGNRQGRLELWMEASRFYPLQSCFRLLGGRSTTEPNIPGFSCFHQHQQESHSQTVTSLTAELRDLRLELRKKEKERRESERAWRSSREDWKSQEGDLVDSLDRRDRLIEVAWPILLPHRSLFLS